MPAKKITTHYTDQTENNWEREDKNIYWKQQQWNKEFMCFDSQKVYNSHVEINEILDFTPSTFLPVLGCKEKGFQRNSELTESICRNIWVLET